MDLPNYFLADLPREAALSTTMLAEAVQALRNNRERYLASRTTLSLIELLGALGSQWLDPEYPFRKLALERGPSAAGFSRATLERGLDSFFKQLTASNLASLVEQDLGHAERLDQIAQSNVEAPSGRAALATGPELLVHIAAGNLPVPAFMGIVLGLLAHSAQFIKCASGASFLPSLFAHSLYDADHKLGACLEIAEWRGGTEHLDATLFEAADCLTATGTDETLAAIRAKLPPRARLLAYGHRVSFGYISSEALQGSTSRSIAARAAADVAAWNQLGCLSPHVVYVESGGGITPEQFAEILSDELASLEANQPRGELPAAIAGAIASRRSIYEMRAAQSSETRLWCSQDSTAWTVVYEAEPRFQISCLHRFIYVKSVAGLEQALQAADSVREKVSTVGLAAPEHKLREFAMRLGRWGVSRVCPLGRMQEPPLGWRHDGRPALGELVAWTDFEK